MRRLVVDPASPDPDAIGEAAQVIRAGGLVAFPTETVYGLGANARSREALDRIYAAKGRPHSDPLIVHIGHPDDLLAVGRELPALARPLAARFWPGPLTLVVPRRPELPDTVSAGLPTVGVRMPAHPVALALIRAAGVPIAAPSANAFSRPSPTTADHVEADLGGRIDLLLDAGPTRFGLESTVLDLTHAVPVVLRPGATSIEELRELVPLVAVRQRFAADEEATAAPGQLLRHYSPHADLFAFTGPDQAVTAALRDAIELARREGRRVGVICDRESAAAFRSLGAEVAVTGAGGDLAATGARLFAAMRELDGAGVDVMLARDVGRQGLGLAIWDRLVRAANGKVVDCDGASNT